MGEIEGRDRRLPHIGIDMPRQAAEPGLDGVHRLDHAGEIAPLNDLLDQAELFIGCTGIAVPDGDRRRDKGLSDLIRTQFLQRASASIALLWASVSSSVDASLVITSLRMAPIDFLLANHCRRILVSSLVASVLSSMIARVDQRYDESQAIEVVQNSWRRRARKADDRENSQMGRPSIGSRPPVSGWSASSASMYMGISGTRTR